MAMATGPTSGTSGEEHMLRSFRLLPKHIGFIEDVAKGALESASGLKSCAPAYVDIALGISVVDARSMHEPLYLEDEDECFNMMGDMLANGFSFEEIAKTVRLDGGATHLLALERWCDSVKLRCKPDLAPPPGSFVSTPWTGSFAHEDRARARQVLHAMRNSREGMDHAAVLHIVYGWPDPFVRTLAPDVRAALGAELAPLARYTDAVEEKRRELVKLEAARETRFEMTPTKDVPWHWGGNATAREDEIKRDVPGDDDRVQHGSEARRAAIAMGLRAEQKNAGVVDLNARRERLAWADKVISSGDALRAAVAKPRARHADEPKRQYREQVALPAKAAQEAFLSLVRIEANRMLTAASRAFQEAWRGS